MVLCMVIDRDAEGMRVGHVKYLRNCHGSATDLLRITTNRFAYEKDWSFDCFLIRKPFLWQSVDDPVRSGNVFTDIYWCRSVKDKRDATRTSRMVLGTIRILTDELRKSYGYPYQIRSVQTLQKNPTVLIFP